MFARSRDVSLVNKLNRELLGNVITQQASFYKYKLEETKVNLYGESAEEKYYIGPVLLDCLVERDPQSQPETDLGTDFTWNIIFKFLRDDLLIKLEDFNGDNVTIIEWANKIKYSYPYENITVNFNYKDFLTRSAAKIAQAQLEKELKDSVREDRTNMLS